MCACVCSSHFVALIDTAVVPSFTLLPVSLFPVYLAVICFTKVWWCEMICVFLHHRHPQTVHTLPTSVSLWNILCCLKINEQCSLQFRQKGCGSILSGVCWVLSDWIHKNGWSKRGSFDAVLVNLKMLHCAVKVCHCKSIVAVVSLCFSAVAVLEHTVCPDGGQGNEQNHVNYNTILNVSK